MFEQSLGLRENPFVAGHQPRFVYPSREHQEALAHLRFGIENREPFVLITGEVGTGKTTAIYDALSGWGTRAVVALITNSALTRAELIEEISLRFGLALTPGMTKPQALVLLERHLLAVKTRQELAILLLDEAQNLERELLEEIRLLSNLEHDGQKLLQIFLVGQPELEAKLGQPELRQLRQRIGVHYRLQPMTAEETMHYLHHRIAVAGGNANQLFPPETCREVHRLTHGIPREINTVASKALLNAYVDDSHVVRPQHATAVARDSEFKSVLDVHGPRPAVAAAAAPSLAPPPDQEATRPVVLPAATPTMPAPPPEPERPPMLHEADADADPNYTPTPEEVAAIMADASSTWAENGVEPQSEEPAVEAEAEVEAQVSSEISHESEAATDSDVLAAAEMPEGGGITMPDWLEQAIAKHAPAGEPPAPAQPMAPVARTPEPADTAVPSFLTGPTADEPEEYATPQSSFAQAMSREQERVAEREAYENEQPEYRTARILPLPGTSTGAEPDFIPARLRAKLEREAKAPQRRANIAWVMATILAAAAIVTIVMAWRTGVFASWTGADSTATAPAPTATVAPKVTTPAPATVSVPDPSEAVAETMAATPRAPTGGIGATVPSSGVPVSGLGTNASSATATAAGESAVRRIYGIAVGTYFDRERALQEAQRVGASLNLAARAMPVAEGGATMFRAVVGRFATRAEAERMAGALTGRGLANEGRVVMIGTAQP